MLTHIAPKLAPPPPPPSPLFLFTIHIHIDSIPLFFSLYGSIHKFSKNFSSLRDPLLREYGGMGLKREQWTSTPEQYAIGVLIQCMCVREFLLYLLQNGEEKRSYFAYSGPHAPGSTRTRNARIFHSKWEEICTRNLVSTA
jgi:hypothetical protein